jgi:ketosteroid isomerase-like protein
VLSDEERAMTESPREVLARYHQAMKDMNADDLADLYAPDAVHVFPFLAPGRPSEYRGREEVRAGYREAWAGRPVRLTEIHDVVVYETADPELVVGEWSATGTVAATGQPFALSGLLALRVRDGRIVEVRDYMDALNSARQLGRLPALATALTPA